VHVDDVVTAMINATGRGEPGSIFQLVDDTRPVTQDEYIETCRKALSQPLRVMHLSRPVLYMAAVGMELLGSLLRRGVPLSRYRVRSIKELHFDCSRTKRELAWEPCAGKQDSGDLSEASAAVAS